MEIEGIGIDFGTYNTKISVVYKNRPLPEPFESAYLADIVQYGGVIPSFILCENRSCVIGREARLKYPKSIYGMKLRTGEENWDNYTLSFLNLLRRKLERALGIDLGKIKVHFTRPVTWNSEKVEKYKKIIERAGFRVADEFLSTEPYAAAVAIVKQKKIEKGNMLVVDAGAGTIDVSIVGIVGDGKLKEKYSKGLLKAGRYVDELLSKHLYGEVREDKIFGIEEAKIKVGSRRADNFNLKEGLLVKFHDVEEAVKSYREEIRNFLKEFKKENFDYIVLSGGFSKFYIFEELVKELFPGKAVLYYGNKIFGYTDFAIPDGAALNAAGKASISERVRFPVYIWFIDYGENIEYERELLGRRERLNKNVKANRVLLEVVKKDDYIEEVVNGVRTDNIYRMPEGSALIFKVRDLKKSEKIRFAIADMMPETGYIPMEHIKRYREWIISDRLREVDDGKDVSFVFKADKNHIVTVELFIEGKFFEFYEIGRLKEL